MTKNQAVDPSLKFSQVMKTFYRNLARVSSRVAMLSMAVGLAVSANAQSVRLPGEELTVPDLSITEFDSRATSQSAIDAASTKRTAMTSTSISINQELPKAVDQALSKISVEQVRAGGSKATVILGGTRSLVDEQAVNVKISFEERPVGGILTVRASMTPSFRGVGVSTRPAISRSVAMAVDEVDQKLINDLVRELTAEITGEFALN